ncbi:hypothetical protein ACOSQ2_022469 [Xanthoceras sorbifolium]
MVATEADKCRRFEDGLNDYIRLQVAAFEFEDFTKLVSAALNVERIKKEEQARRDRGQQRRGVGPSSSYQPQTKKFKGLQSGGPVQSQRPIPTARPGQSVTSIASTPRSAVRGPAPVLCEHCGRRHPGECWKITGACLRCGSCDHFLKDFPQLRSIPVQQPERSAPTTSRSRRPSQAGTEGGSHRGMSSAWIYQCNNCGVKNRNFIGNHIWRILFFLSPNTIDSCRSSTIRSSYGFCNTL